MFQETSAQGLADSDSAVAADQARVAPEEAAETNLLHSEINLHKAEISDLRAALAAHVAAAVRPAPLTISALNSLLTNVYDKLLSYNRF